MVLADWHRKYAVPPFQKKLKIPLCPVNSRHVTYTADNLHLCSSSCSKNLRWKNANGFWKKKIILILTLQTIKNTSTIFFTWQSKIQASPTYHKEHQRIPVTCYWNRLICICLTQPHTWGVLIIPEIFLNIAFLFIMKQLPRACSFVLPGCPGCGPDTWHQVRASTPSPSDTGGTTLIWSQDYSPLTIHLYRQIKQISS